ncbi:hypothetical protein, partial [Endozoicomonas sp. ONNA2]|uniref:hypothetical protein n=1 Tax=Endozoicomonas sp. ONNA2 TaxID=2828741 RepID=UPI0021474461
RQRRAFLFLCALRVLRGSKLLLLELIDRCLMSIVRATATPLLWLLHPYSDTAGRLSQNSTCSEDCERFRLKIPDSIAGLFYEEAGIFRAKLSTTTVGESIPGQPPGMVTVHLVRNND